MNNPHLDSQAIASAPILDLSGDAFHLTYGAEPLPEERPGAVVTLMLATRGVEVWRIVWRGPASALVLYHGETEVWRAEMTVSPTLACLMLTAPFEVVAQQFLSHNERKARFPATKPRGSVGARMVRAIQTRVSSPAAIGRGVFTLGRWLLMFMGLVLLVTMLSQWKARASGNLAPGSHYGTAPVSASPAPAPELPPELRDRTLGETLSPTEMQVVANATREMGIQMRPSGQPFVVFSDPNCPSCKDLEPKLSQVDPRFVPVIVPVSFKPGSEDLVKRVLCAKDTVSAWSAAIGAYAPTGDAVSDGTCAGAADKALKANGAFVALNFSGTPTLVSATGKVIAGSGSLDDINKWLAQNGGLKPDVPRVVR